MASKLLNVRMDQKMIEDLKKVCGELEISVTDAIKLFSNKLIEERTLPTKKEKEKTIVLEDEEAIKDLMDSIEEEKEVGHNEEKYIQLHNELSEILSFYCKEFGYLIDSTIIKQTGEKTFFFDDETPFSEIAKTFKEQYEEELKKKILDKMTEFYENYHKEFIEAEREGFKMAEEEKRKEKKVENDKYIDVMENLKNENPDLYRELLNKYSYNIDYDEIQNLGFENYNDAKKKLEEFLTPEEIKALYDCILGSDSYIVKKKSSKEFDNSVKNYEILKNDTPKYYEDDKSSKRIYKESKTPKRIYKEQNDFTSENKVLENALLKYYEYIDKKNSQNQSKENNNSEEK